MAADNPHNAPLSAICYPYFYNSIQFNSASQLQAYMDAQVADAPLPVDEVDIDPVETSGLPAPVRTTPRVRG